MLPHSLVLVGAGKMGGAMLMGWLSEGLSPRAVTVLDPHPSDDLTHLCKGEGIALNPPRETIREAEVVVLAVKPQMLDEVAPQLEAVAGPSTLVLSVLAGKTIANLAARLPRASAIVRSMPNTPAAVGRGITAAIPNPAVSPEQRTLADTLLQAIGEVVWLDDEAHIDAVTAVSGSGPAYVFHLVECMAAAGVTAGLPADVAARLARATVEGSGELMFQTQDVEPAQLRRNVTSPGGTTAAALEVLMAGDGMEALMTRAIEAARRRAAELSG